MHEPDQNLSSKIATVKGLASRNLIEAINIFNESTTQNLGQRPRAPYFRRLQLLAAGSPRSMNFAGDWIRAIRRSSTSRFDSYAIGRSTLLLQNAAAEMVNVIRIEIRSRA